MSKFDNFGREADIEALLPRRNVRGQLSIRFECRRLITAMMHIIIYEHVLIVMVRQQAPSHHNISVKHFR